MSDTIVWITGASSGIGRALAASVPYERARVVDVSRSGGTPGTEHVPADLADPASWAALEAHLAAEVTALGGGRAVLIQAAGTLEPIGFAGEVDPGAYRRNVLVNAAAPLALGNAFLAATRAFPGTADLVLLTSGAARTPYEGWSSYCAAKAACDAWVRVAGAEQRRRGTGVRVLAVAPGVVETPMQERIRATDERDFPQVGRFRALHDEGRLRAPADAAAGLWALLASDAASGAVLDLRDVEGLR